MGQRIQPGDSLPYFRYDTPFAAAQPTRQLLQNAPLVLVFLSNFGHPVTRTLALRYADTFSALQSGGLALVVRSHPEKLARSLKPGRLPYPLMCDAKGVLYELLDIPQKTGMWRTCSLEAMRILHKAKASGYKQPKGEPQQMPLTLVLDENSTVLFSHYGSSLTDVPTDCAAVQKLLEHILQQDAAPKPVNQTQQRIDALYDKVATAGARQAWAEQAEQTEYTRQPVAPPKAVPAGKTISLSTEPELERTAVNGIFGDPYPDEE